MPILSYLKLGGGLMLALGILWGGWVVKGKFDRAADADRVEAVAVKAVNDANGRLTIATAQIEALKQGAVKADLERSQADAIVHAREEADALTIEALRKRAHLLAPRAAVCSYAPGTGRLLADAWAGRAAAGDGLPDAAVPAH